MSKTFCPLPWKHLSTLTNGSMRACCQNIYEPFGILKKESGENYHAAKDSFTEAQNSSTMKKLRREMLAGIESDICKLCWDEEKFGHTSKRIRELKRDPTLFKKALILTNEDGAIDPSNFPVSYLDLRLGNKCNFRCRYCGPTDSNSWYSDFVQMSNQDTFYLYDNTYKINKDESGWSINSNDFNWYESPSFTKMIEGSLEHVTHFYFTGGEPTLIQPHWDILLKCIEKGVAANIYLEYNTNLSFITDKHIEIWSHFKRVGLGCSIDAINDAAPYLRPPVTWDKIDANIKKVNLANCKLDACISTTHSVFNALMFLDIIRYNLNLDFKNFESFPNTHYLEYPHHFSLKILPEKAKKVVVEKYLGFERTIANSISEYQAMRLREKIESLKNYLESEDWSHLIKQFYRENEKLDQIRGQSFTQVLPEVHELLQMR